MFPFDDVIMNSAKILFNGDYNQQAALATKAIARQNG